MRKAPWNLGHILSGNCLISRISFLTAEVEKHLRNSIRDFIPEMGKVQSRLTATLSSGIHVKGGGQKAYGKRQQARGLHHGQNPKSADVGMFWMFSPVIAGSWPVRPQWDINTSTRQHSTPRP
jgi:hypothetical protein